MKNEQQIMRKAKHIQNRMNELNDPKRYEGRSMTMDERDELYDVLGQWKAFSWLTGKYKFV